MKYDIFDQFTCQNGIARKEAFAKTVEVSNLIPPTVSYDSHGHLVIIGKESEILTVAKQVEGLNSITLLSTEKAELPEQVTENTFSTFYSNNIEVAGYLGNFSVKCMLENAIIGSANLAEVAINRKQFDVIIDLSEKPMIALPVAPIGYYHIAAESEQLADVIESVSGLIGEFDKPKYFQLNSDICAHNSRGVKGCTRCLSVCPAGAISSDDFSINIDPFLCQGVGTCATACPTEAISYALPEALQSQHYLFNLLNNYRASHGQSPSILFFGQEDLEQVNTFLATASTSILPIALEEVGSVGLDTWLTALLYGAEQVTLAKTATVPASIYDILTSEVEIAQSMLSHVNIDTNRIGFVGLDEIQTVEAINWKVSSDKSLGNKRERIFDALDQIAADHLDFETTPEQKVSLLPNDAPYGSVNIETKDCTLCLSCVAVCPTRAIHGFDNQHGLQFVEQDCIQCGLCESACPEKVITLEPRLVWDRQERQEPRVIHKEPAAECLTCGKPFAPASLIDKLQQKLAGHSHFKDDAIKRIAMCEDCRVKDIFQNINDNPESQLEI
ncbi:4Fe-4S dicluster domain-containing protein [Vibrio sp. SS-MA-C1-2]|uniref:4Fe-4S dicluster domain-containing protein n=1 Tax=Vibrio sp. SS-MA-C1-2 TaxID=2908646 RepID=UPI001F3DA636|nr:4Fe-4S dicluster domain-containing protein [Vibrio sp. SS-MA-C1-2]UJF18150.1 4Fe-4S dicluster domain-containing protein [Vibrio sp. SS-MA-C1-2]